MLIAALVPSAESVAYAVIAGAPERLVRHGVAAVRTAIEVEALIATVAVYQPVTVGLDGGELLAGRPSPKTAVVIGRLLQALEAKGLPVAITSPGIGLLEPAPALVPSAASAPAAVELVRQRFGAVLPFDQAAAVAFALYIAATPRRKAA
jgi:hypothetical protein